MSVMMTTCVAGHRFSHAHTFQISADVNVLDWFEVCKPFREWPGSSELCVGSLQIQPNFCECADSSEAVGTISPRIRACDITIDR
jgi:hypothetical protein